MKNMSAEMIVTPWEVKGELDYNKLVEQFGTQPLNENLIKRIEKIAGKSHIFLDRQYYYSHRDLPWFLDEFEKGNEVCLYTGRGPSGNTQLGHLTPYLFTKYLQEAFDCDLYFQMTDDEKFLVKPKSMEEIQLHMHENILDVIAIGFNPKKTHIISDIDNIKSLYKIALRTAKLTTFSTAKSVFGFTNESNIGIVFFPAMQAAPAFLPSDLKGKKVPCLIPCAIDQDPYWRITRDVASRLGYYKPAVIHSKFFSSLGRGGKMSASEPETCIFVTDSEDEIKRKVKNAFTGGASTIAEQKKNGGNPGICSVYNYLYYLFEDDKKHAQELAKLCKSGSLTCGECKERLVKYVTAFVKQHQKKREAARDKVDKYLFKE